MKNKTARKSGLMFALLAGLALAVAHLKTAQAFSFGSNASPCNGAVICNPAAASVDQVVMTNSHFDVGGGTVTATIGGNEMAITAGSNDFRGTATANAAAGGSVIIVFGTAFKSTPFCGIDNSSATVSSYASNFTTMTVTNVNAAGVVSWHCLGY